MEEFPVRHLSGPAAALVQWAALGLALIGGYLVAYMVGARFVRCQKRGAITPIR